MTQWKLNGFIVIKVTCITHYQKYQVMQLAGSMGSIEIHDGAFPIVTHIIKAMHALYACSLV